jgi:hypothetical protein
LSVFILKSNNERVIAEWLKMTGYIESGEHNLGLRRHQIFFKIPSYFCFEKSHIGKTRKKRNTSCKSEFEGESKNEITKFMRSYVNVGFAFDFEFRAGNNKG